MSKGRIKAVLFIIVFLLVIAVAVNLLMDMQSERKADATPTNDPYANTVTPSVETQPALETPQPTPAIKWENNTKLETLLASTVHTLSLPSGSSASFPLAAQYQFGGTYSKVDLPVIECGGTIELSR